MSTTKMQAAERECLQNNTCLAYATSMMAQVVTSKEHENCCWNLFYCQCLSSSSPSNCSHDPCRLFCPRNGPILQECLTSRENDILSLYSSFIVGLVMIIVYVVAVFTSFSKKTLAKFQCWNCEIPMKEKTMREASSKAEITLQQNLKIAGREKRSRSKLIAKIAERRQQPTMYQLAKSKAASVINNNIER